MCPNHEAERPHGCDGLTDRASQKKCGRCDVCASALRRYSITLRTRDPEVVDHSNAHARYLVLPHDSLNIQPSLDLLDAPNVGAGLPAAGTDRLCRLRSKLMQACNYNQGK